VARLAEAAVPTARAAVYVRRGDDYELAAAPRLGGRWTRVGFRVPSEDFAGAVPGTAETAPARLRELAADQGLGFAWTVAAPGTEPPTGVVVVFVGEKRFLHAGERAGLDRAAHVLARTLDSERRIDAEHRAVTSDPLSGVAARAATVAALGSAPVGANVMAVQVDGIDAINREHGVAVGDAVLAQVGRTLHEQTRRRDLVGRVGSRTFVVVSTGGRDDDGSANSWAERITATLRTPVLADGARLEPACRIAVTAVRRDQDGLGALDDVLGRLRGKNLRSGLAVGDR
jgi:diguanylate cyclase (GGDEF)-like protein